MTFKQWLQSHLLPRPTPAYKRPPVRRPAVERLEDRTTPSTGGILDPTFGSGGQVISSFSNHYDRPDAVIAQPDGKLLVAGVTLASRTGYDFLVARYNLDGTQDASF